MRNAREKMKYGEGQMVCDLARSCPSDNDEGFSSSTLSSVSDAISEEIEDDLDSEISGNGSEGNSTKPS